MPQTDILSPAPWTEEKPTMALRWVDREHPDGVLRFLQQCWTITEIADHAKTTSRTEWRDVPLEQET